VLWVLTFGGLLNDGRTLLGMMSTVIASTLKCSMLNHRGVFDAFLPLRDQSGYGMLGQAGLGDARFLGFAILLCCCLSWFSHLRGVGVFCL
jgi:hypothetical protein